MLIITSQTHYINMQRDQKLVRLSMLRNTIYKAMIGIGCLAVGAFYNQQCDFTFVSGLYLLEEG